MSALALYFAAFLALEGASVDLPLPGGGSQRFAAPRVAPRAAFATAPRELSFAFDPPSLYRLYTSSDLVNWVPLGEATREPTVVYECSPVEKRRFWKAVLVAEM